MKALRILDRAVAVISWLTLLALAVLSVAKRLAGATLPCAWAETWLVPILTGAAVGYLTNYLAIWLLFRPYHRHGPFWGVIPRNQPRLAQSLGTMIPERLLPPEELAKTITELAGDFLRNPDMLARVRLAVTDLASEKGRAIAGFLMPYASNALRTVLADHLNARTVSRLVGFASEQFLAQPENRAMIAEGVVTELQKKVPQLTVFLRVGMREAALEYVNRKFGFMAKMLGGAEGIVDGIIGNLDWNGIAQRISERLATAETRQALAEEVSGLAGRLREYLQGAEAQHSLDQFIRAHSVQLENALAAYLQEKLPGMLETVLANNALWSVVEKKLLPYLQQWIEQELEAHSEAIIARLNLPGRIESAVNSLEPAEAHQIINQVSGRELTLLQVLGFVLGALAGLLMIFAR